MPRINYMYGEEEHGRWKAAAEVKGQTLREWVRRALNQIAEEQEAEEADRKRRTR